jgi:spore germination cell wall hydrolase CwlJ-like protein
MIKKFIVICVAVAATVVNATTVPPLTDSNAIRTIVGESSNQGYIGMLGVADVIRNRKSLQGFYGFNNPVVNKSPKRILEMAKKAWYESKTNDVTGGAIAFENVKAFGMPKWAKKMKVTKVIKDHTFFK